MYADDTTVHDQKSKTCSDLNLDTVFSLIWSKLSSGVRLGLHLQVFKALLFPFHLSEESFFYLVSLWMKPLLKKHYDLKDFYVSNSP